MLPPDERSVLGNLPASFTVIEFGNKKNPSGRYSEFYRALGCDAYRSIDWNGRDGAYPLDVNMPINPEAVDLDFSADVVTNFGFSEHVTDQPAFWANHHYLCRPGGTMCGVTPAPGHWPRHGILQPTPDFYQILADMNGYRVEDLWVNKNRKRWTVCYRFRKHAQDRIFVMPEGWEALIIPTKEPTEQALRNSGLR